MTKRSFTNEVDVLAALYNLRSIEFSSRIVLLGVPVIAVTIFMDRYLPLFWFILYYALVAVVYQLTRRFTKSPTQTNYNIIVAAEAFLQMFFLSLPIYFWQQPEPALKFGAAALMIGIILNGLSQHCRLMAFAMIDGVLISAVILFVGVRFMLDQSGSGAGYFGLGFAIALSGYFAVTQIDVFTTRHKLEEATRIGVEAQKVSAIGRLTAGVAHDFNNILTVVMGNLDLLREVKDVNEKDALALESYEAAKRASLLTSQMLAFSRQVPLITETVEMPDFLVSYGQLACGLLPRSIKFEIQHFHDLWSVRVDPHQCKTALLNLTINAADAMPDGGAITLRVHNVATPDAALNLPDGPYVMLELHDEGDGISPENLDNVCEPFFTTKPVGKGSGLGLSMAKGFAEQSGGALLIDSLPGDGTTISMILPAQPAPEPEHSEVPDVKMKPLLI